MIDTEKRKDFSMDVSMADQMEFVTDNNTDSLMDSGEYIEILSFTHFARYMSFSSTGKQDRKKCIMDGVEVSVVLHFV